MRCNKSTSGFRYCVIRKFILLITLLFVSCTASRKTVSESVWLGVWSAPSLSRPDVPIQIALLKDGTATEQVGDYRGVGAWKMVGNSIRIDWHSQWVGVLRSSSDGIQLATWRSESPKNAPPDDVQPATRVQ